jgi:hypothetical protein
LLHGCHVLQPICRRLNHGKCNSHTRVSHCQKSIGQRRSGLPKTEGSHEHLEFEGNSQGRCEPSRATSNNHWAHDRIELLPTDCY